MKLNREKTLAHLEINGELDAAALDALISKMAELRAAMTPSVAATKPKDPLQAGTPVTMEDSPAMMAAKLKDGRVRFWARSSGFGWLAFNVVEQDALLIRDYLIASLPRIASDLIGGGDGKRH